MKTETGRIVELDLPNDGCLVHVSFGTVMSGKSSAFEVRPFWIPFLLLPFPLACNLEMILNVL